MDDQGNKGASQLLQPITPPQGKNKDMAFIEYTPRTAQEVRFSMQTSILQISVEEPARQPRHGTAVPPEMRPLNQISRKTKDGWKQLGRTDTAVLYKLFEQWVMCLLLISSTHTDILVKENDYSPQEYKISSGLVAMSFFGHPCDRPKDIRARPFILSWITENRKAPEQYKDSECPILRVEYRCLGACNVEASNSEDSESADEDKADNPLSNHGDDSESDDGKVKSQGIDIDIRKNGIAKSLKGKGGGITCPRKVKIHV